MLTLKLNRKLVQDASGQHVLHGTAQGQGEKGVGQDSMFNNILAAQGMQGTGTAA